MSQERIHDRSQEQPGSSDKGVMLYRSLLRRELAKLSDGKDPDQRLSRAILERVLESI